MVVTHRLSAGFKKYSYTSPPPSVFPQQDCLWKDNGVYLGASKCGFKRYRATSSSSSPTCYTSQAVSRLSDMVEAGAGGLKSLLIFIAVESQNLFCQGCPGQSESLSGWSQLMSSRARWVPEEPCLRHPDSTLKGAAWSLLRHQPLLCPG